jgi:hypothetical protein
VANPDAEGYSKALLTLLAKRRELQTDDVKRLFASSAFNDPVLPASLFSGLATSSSLEKERKELQAELCVGLEYKTLPTVVETCRSAVDDAGKPLAGQFLLGRKTLVPLEGLSTQQSTAPGACLASRLLSASCKHSCTPGRLPRGRGCDGPCGALSCPPRGERCGAAAARVALRCAAAAALRPQGKHNLRGCGAQRDRLRCGLDWALRTPTCLGTLTLTLTP